MITMIKMNIRIIVTVKKELNDIIIVHRYYFGGYLSHDKIITLCEFSPAFLWN